MNELHSLLKRQLRRFTSDAKLFLEEQPDFLKAINDAYEQFDADRRMLEHSLELTSQELLERNTELSRINAELEMRVAARTAELSNSEARFRGLFEHAPVSIWQEDFSTVRQYIDDLRRAGTVDLSAHFDAHPEAIAECAAQVKIVDVNQATLEMYQAESKTQLLTDLSRVLGPESLSMFKLELLALAEGKLPFEQETVNYTLGGERLIVFLRMTIAPGYAESWAKVFVGISDITERRKAESALAAERDLLQALMDNIPDTIYFKDTASQFTRINRAQARVLGVPAPEDAIGKTDLDFFQDAELAQSFYEEEQRIVKSGEPLMNRIEFNPTPDGQPRWFSATKVPIQDENGHITGIVGISHDITERTQVQEALRKSDAQTRGVLDQALDAVITIDSQSQIIGWNPQAETIFGWSRQEAIGQALYDLIIPAQYREAHQRGLTHFLVSGEGPVLNRRIEITGLRRNGYEFPVELAIAPVNLGETFTFTAFIRDITERRQAEEALRQSEEKYRSLVERLPAITYISAFDEAKTRLYVSPQNEKYLGFSPTEWLADPDLWRNQLHPDDRKRVLAEAARFYETEEPFISEYRTLSRDGKSVWFHDEAVIVRDAKGQPQYIQGVKVNITERKQAEEALRQSEERFKLMAWATKDAVWDWNFLTNQIEWGIGLQKIFHYSSETTQTDSEWWLEHIHTEDREKVSRSMKQALEGGMEFWSKEYRFQRVDKTYANIMDRGYIIRDHAGKPYRIIGAMMDITAQKQAEAALQEANEKMARSLNELALRNHEIALLNEMSDLLQASPSERAAHTIIGDAARQLFPGTTGALYLFNTERTLVKSVASWGDPPPAAQTFAPDDCWALQRGQTRQLYEEDVKPPCRHVLEALPVVSYCLPMVAQNEILGVLHLQSPSTDNLTEPKRQLAYTVVEQVGMALSNLKLREALREQSIRDPLTGLYNRRYMEEVLKQHLRRVTRHLHPLGIIMIDIDHFKSFNDTHGHAAGDALLRELGRFLQSHIRAEDVACRYGGEEFILIMPDAFLETARQRAEYLREQAKGVHVHDVSLSLGGITLSLGVAIYPQHGRTMEAVMRAADTALYRAKQEGRDRVVVANSAN